MMSCKIPYSLLMRFHDGDFPAVRLPLLRLLLNRHLRDCPRCAEALTDMKRVDVLLQSADYFAVETRQKALPLRPIGLVSGIALAAGAVLFFAMPGGVVRPTISFARVEEALASVRTATWTVMVEGESETNGKVRRWRSTALNWADLVQAKIATIEPDKDKDGKGSKMVFDGTKILAFLPGNNVYFLSDPMPRDYGRGKTPLERVRSAVLFKQENLREENTSFSSATMRYSWKPWISRNELLEDKSTLRFDRTGSYKLEFDNPKFNDDKKTEFTETIWVEPDTYRLIRRETVSDGKSRLICSGYRYNETPPPGTFEVPKPKIGVPYRFVDDTHDSPSRKFTKLTGAEYTAAVATMTRAIQAWDKGDPDAFVREFDFEEVAWRHEVFDDTKKQTPAQYAASQRWQWRSRVKNRDAYLSWQAPEFLDVAYNHYEAGYIRRKESDPFPPQPEYGMCAGVRLQAQVRLKKDPTHVQTLPTTFNLIKRKGQWRIFWFNQWTSPTQWSGKKQDTKK
jgi:outer membrane lipoprotein-sorting protein